MDWTKLIDIKQSFAVNSTVNSKYFNHSQYIALKTKDAIADHFREKMDIRPSVDRERPDVLINVHVSHTTCNVSIDSSGRPLNQRGYRDRTVDAPINEVLAAGLIALSGWDGKSNFVDIMYGSGTILIEAAMFARNIAPSKNREYFAFKHWDDFDKDLFFEILDDLKSKEIKFEHEIVGCDVSRRAFTIAKENINYANLKGTIMVVKKDFEKFEPPTEGGFLITNPPYNERMPVEDAIEFVKKIGDKFKTDFKGYKCFVFSGDLESVKHLGLKTTSKQKLFNGSIECRLNKYDIY
jgi:putative N6-adenine-specific DNA methylase